MLKTLKTRKKFVFISRLLDQQHCVYAAIVFRIIGDLRVFAPNDLASLGDKSQFADIDLQNGSLCYNSQTSI